mmetsp:Transcript_921/g.1214  ORF Transcript_921/g.1214 Transcript_921/m.1214 type:complete len:107 (+) Transcript_921:1727-2047(+)
MPLTKFIDSLSTLIIGHKEWLDSFCIKLCSDLFRGGAQTMIALLYLQQRLCCWTGRTGFMNNRASRLWKKRMWPICNYERMGNILKCNVNVDVDEQTPLSISLALS